MLKYHKIQFLLWQKIMIQINIQKKVDLLNGMKRYLKIEHQDDDIELLEYIRKQAGVQKE